MSLSNKVRIVITALAIGFTVFACKRSQPQMEWKHDQLHGVPLARFLSEPPFVGLVVRCDFGTVPSLDGTGEVNFFAIDVKREDGTQFAITALPASAADVEAAKRLKPGQSYRFPDALREAPRYNSACTARTF